MKAANNPSAILRGELRMNRFGNVTRFPVAQSTDFPILPVTSRNPHSDVVSGCAVFDVTKDFLLCKV
jgi:hypothetical protein